MDGDESSKRKEADINKTAAYLSLVHRHATFLQHHQVAPPASLPAASEGGDSHFDISAGFQNAHSISPLWSPMGGAGLMPQGQVSELNTIDPGLQQPFVLQRNVLGPNSVIQQTGLAETAVKSKFIEPTLADSNAVDDCVIRVEDYNNVREQQLSVGDSTTSSVKRNKPTTAKEGAFDGRWCSSCCNRTGPCEAGVQNSCQVCVHSYVSVASQRFNLAALILLAAPTI